MSDQWNHKIFNVNKGGFESLALEIFRFQAANNPVYNAFIRTLGYDPEQIKKINGIPFLPVRFFKTHKIQTTEFEPRLVFESSGTSGTTTSRHFVKDPLMYEESFTRGFESVYGPVKDWCILGLLPSYLERSNSSLVYMVDHLIKRSEHPASGFFLHDLNNLQGILWDLEEKKTRTLLIGVTYALLDMAEKFPLRLSGTVIMETGGMKGRREELIREEVHARLKAAFGVKTVHSEYGMTELLSQAYSTGNGVFKCPHWMKIIMRDDEDPFELNQTGKGVINVIDLANLYSCSFIATDDAGKLNEDGSFEVLGRVDGSDMRGCSLLTTI